MFGEKKSIIACHLQINIPPIHLDSFTLSLVTDKIRGVVISASAGVGLPEVR